MKLALLCDDYLPHSTRVGAKMLHELARELVLLGHHVTVITPQSNASPSPLLSETLEEVVVWRFECGPIKDVSKFRRAINESLISLYAWRQIRKQVKEDTFDGIIYYSPSIFFGPLAAKLKKRCICKSYLVLRDFFPQWAVDAGLIKKGSAIDRYFRFFETVTYRNADMIGVMSPGNLEIFNQRTDNRYKASVLRNWTRVEPHNIIGVNANLRQRLGLKDKIIFFYGGNIGHAQDMNNLMRLVRRMQKFNNAHFLFVGQGDEVKLINELAIEWKLSNYSYLPSVTQDEYRDMLTQVDVGLFSLSAKHTSHNFPGKLLGYMLQSLPILGSVNQDNDLINLIQDNRAGFISVNGDDEIFFDSATKLYKNPELRNKIGLAGNALLHKEFAVMNAASIITEFFSGHNKNI
ncbi:glycosyltransferase family 4 protein [Gammaproteobacteria bacterium]|nr:glycosyltransferase family 4 protein [Gammaproteobacteria bacterium]